MDPLSITAATVGLIGAIEAVSRNLRIVSSSIRNVPQVMTSLRTEMNELGLAVSVLQRLIKKLDQLPKSRTRLICLEQLMATLTEAVLTISEIDIHVKAAATKRSNWTFFDRVKVTFAGPEIKTLVDRIQRNKSSLNLIFNILQW